MAKLTEWKDPHNLKCYLAELRREVQEVDCVWLLNKNLPIYQLAEKMAAAYSRFFLRYPPSRLMELVQAGEGTLRLLERCNSQENI